MYDAVGAVVYLIAVGLLMVLIARWAFRNYF